MTFIDKNSDPSIIIKDYRVKGDNYLVEYLDGSKNNYYCSSDNEESRIKEEMIKQAIERKDKINIKLLELASDSSLIVALLSTICSLAIKNSGMTIAMLLVVIASIYTFAKNSRKIKELKKYEMFLEMKDSLNEINTPKYMKHIEFENIYQKDLGINTVDDFTYGETKTLYKVYSKEKKQ